MGWIKSISPKLINEKLGMYEDSTWFKEMDRCWKDTERGYEVTSRLIRTEFGTVEHVAITKHTKDSSIISTGGETTITWAEKQQIKNELFGKDRFAIEVYPKEKMLIDVVDCYHLWVFDKKKEMPFGIHYKEYAKAINRGDGINKAELEALMKAYDDEAMPLM
jgi:hypothetical protein